MQQQVVQQQAVAAPQLRPLDVEAMWELFDFAYNDIFKTFLFQPAEAAALQR